MQLMSRRTEQDLHLLQRLAETQGVTRYNENGAVEHAPIALIPATVESGWRMAMERLTLAWNRLSWNVAHDIDCLENAFGHLRAENAYLAFLLRISRQSWEAQPCSMLISRNDCMIDQHGVPRQVEFNTVAASFAGLMDRVNSVHLGLYYQDVATIAGPPDVSLRCESIAQSFVRAIEQYPGACKGILMVSQPDESNAIDQWALMQAVSRRTSLPILSRTLEELAHGSRLGPGGELLVEECEIGLVYFRAGYVPADLAGTDQRAARERIECSRAIKCPNAPLQLAGMKRIQQLASSRNFVSKYLSQADVDLVLGHSMRQIWLHDIRSNENVSVLRELKANPSLFLAKPQMEGGGNNVFGQAVLDLIERSSDAQLSQYVLMERIQSTAVDNTLLVRGNHWSGPCLSEHGTYGVFIGSEKEVLVNEHAGSLVRTKSFSVDEGGVCAGYACLNSTRSVADGSHANT